jgi:hypothetical protein
MASTNTNQARTAKLSCRHTITVPESVNVGDPVQCPKCPAVGGGAHLATRSIKLIKEGPAKGRKPSTTPAELAEQRPAEAAAIAALAAPVPEGAHTNRVARLKAAEREAKALGQWKASGASNGRPATPNLDAVEAERQAGARSTTGAPVVKATNGNGTAKRGPERSERHRAHVEARKAIEAKGTRGPGRKLPEAEFLAYVANVRAEHGAEGSRTNQEYAYWVDKLAFSKATWDKAWEAAGS